MRTLRHVGKGALNLLVARLDAVTLHDEDLEVVVDQRFQGLLARRRLVSGHLNDLRALRDVDLRDRRAVDQRDDLRLRGQGSGA